MNENQTGILFLLIVATAAVYLLGNSSSNSSSEPDAADGNDDAAVTSQTMLDSLTGGIGFMDAGNANPNGYDANLSAFLYMLRMGESSNRYNVRYPGVTFDSYAAHPDVWVAIPSKPGYGSTAAGGYQFIFSTWTQYANELGLMDFSPSSQDAAVVQYLTDLGAMDAIEAGDVAGACAQINARGIVFESLTAHSQATLQGWYNSAGGVLA